ncbi:MAG: phosphosulfolactate synthase [Bacteroidetes bacterium]|nr:MAG: phosphosulfolactate synthase [Bacteroidota bacterium]
MNYSNYFLNDLPTRPAKPREEGLTMVMDKGLSLREAQDLVETSGEHIDIIKLGWATSYVTATLMAKTNFYREAGIPFYFGGTLFEAFLVRNQLDDYRAILDKYQAPMVEISDGSIELPHEEKCKLVELFAKDRQVLSEVGSKDAEKILAPYQWIELMQAELQAGAWKVIGEAREGGNVGLFRDSGEVRQGLVKEIIHTIPADKIIWEAPQKSQQVWFVKLLGANVNLGNIASNEVIPLETLRLGLRGDTFGTFLPKNIKEQFGI